MATNGSASAPLPSHLERYVVAQDYGAYTPRDHAVWRHILGRLTAHLADKAHPSYLEGLAAAGIGLERIPSLAEMNGKLARLGWSAVAVRGFIPPAVFTEMQARGVLAIAEDIRSHEHIEYTPAPDIIHESAGHAPILKDARYAEYLKRCGVAGFKAIASREDQAVYDAVRHLSVVKEDPAAGREDIRQAEARLLAARAGRVRVSESTKASRLYWWTAEYGLVGSMASPRLYGAGLLSSIQEASHCLTPAVVKVPFSLACVDQDFDITRMQPRLFVAGDFDHLFEVLEAFEATLAWKRGGDYGLEQALQAGTVNHLMLDGGREVTGRVVRWIPGTPRADGNSALLAILEGPALVSRAGRSRQQEPWPGQALVAFGPPRPPGSGPFTLDLADGLSLAGAWVGEHEVADLRGRFRGEPLDLPGSALLLQSEGLPGVAGGPADPETWDRWFGVPVGAGDAEQLARRRKAEALPAALGELYLEVARMRGNGRIVPGRLGQIREELRRYPDDWLLLHEVGELLGPLGT
ncbi:MAG: aromatic amino acid hydroxylase [Holophaga sp.]|nr:aromatic amino acid hydroxylase [Holophaga sp.]